jgi:NAD(P)H dehydrogenase (quinone)
VKKKALLVVAHSRAGSLTHQVSDVFGRALRDAQWNVEVADLAAEGFDPVMREADEPDWANPDKIYSPAVQSEIDRIKRNDATIMVFPVYWWSMPALLKGWIDRVWNHGFAYGGAQFPHRRVWMVGIAGNHHDAFAKRGYDQAMQTTLTVGILGYCSVEEARLDILYGSIEGPENPPRILNDAAALAREFRAFT